MRLRGRITKTKLYAAHFLPRGCPQGIMRNKRFPKKPKPEKVSFVSSTLFAGWLIERDYVHDLFGQCEDPQYLMLVNLLDEISCFNFFFYTTFFRGGNLNAWLKSMLRASMIFITLGAETMTRQRCAN